MNRKKHTRNTKVLPAVVIALRSKVQVLLSIMVLCDQQTRSLRQLDLVCQSSACAYAWSTIRLLNLFCVMHARFARGHVLSLLVADYSVLNEDAS